MDAQGRDQALDSSVCGTYRNVGQVGHWLGVVFWWDNRIGAWRRI
jgi:hypothetical protein